MDSSSAKPINASTSTSVTESPWPFNSSNSNSEAVRSDHVLAVNNMSTTSPRPGDEDLYHANAHTQAIVYIVIILVLYFSALTIIIVRYMRKERNQFHLTNYILKKDRSPPSPTASSSFRVASGRRAAANMDNSITADFAEITQCLSTVSNQQMMDNTQQTLHDPSSALLVPCPTNQVQMDTTSV